MVPFTRSIPEFRPCRHSETKPRLGRVGVNIAWRRYLMKSTIMRPVMLVLLLALLSIPGLAQTATTTSISGLVTDSQGAVIPEATVKLVDRGTNQERSIKTNA